jgi:hypothetical protein
LWPADDVDAGVLGEGLELELPGADLDLGGAAIAGENTSSTARAEGSEQEGDEGGFRTDGDGRLLRRAGERESSR